MRMILVEQGLLDKHIKTFIATRAIKLKVD